MRVRLRLLFGSTLAAVTLLWSGFSHAGSGPPEPGKEKFFIAVGGFLVSLENSAQASTPQGVGTTIDLEGLLGLQSDRNVARIEGFWRFKPRHRLDFTLYSMKRNGQRNVAEAFDFNGIHYDVNAAINSEFNQKYLKASYRFAFLNDDRMEVGLTAGLATFVVDGTIEGNGQVLDNGVPTGATTFERSSHTVVAPVPNLGLYGEFRITKTLTLRQNFDYFSLAASEWRARYAELRLGFDWRFTDHFGLGLGYDRTVLEYKESGERSMEVNSDFGGLVWYGSYTF